MTFLRNSWYVAAWDFEVHRLQMMRRLILNEPVLLYRKADGAVVALEDQCCHRQAPLSAGSLRGDNVVCGYHGFTYDPSGACVRIPSQDTIPSNARVKSYPIVERQHLVWIWMGDPDKADETLIEDFPWFEDPGWRFKGERLDLKANYMLLVENLCDLTHLPYVHETTLAATAIPLNEIPVETTRDGNRVRVERWVLDTPTPAYFRLIAGFEKEKRVDRWMHLEFVPPALIKVDIGAAAAGTGAREGDRGQGVTTRNCNLITPETETTTHYFWAQAQDFGLDDPTITDLDFQMVHGAFQEDVGMIEGQQRNIDRDPGFAQVNVASDIGGVQARRIVDDLIAAENRVSGP